jgi:hypothetical protein
MLGTRYFSGCAIPLGIAVAVGPDPVGALCQERIVLGYRAIVSDSQHLAQLAVNIRRRLSIAETIA